MTNFRLFQTERVCRQFQIWRKWQKAIQTGRKLWEKEKLLVTSNFSFPHSVLKKACFPGASKGVIVWEWVKMAAISEFALSAWLNGVLRRFQQDVSHITDSSHYLCLSWVSPILGWLSAWTFIRLIQQLTDRMIVTFCISPFKKI